MKARTNDMTEGTPLKVIIYFAVPLSENMHVFFLSARNPVCAS